MNFWILIYFAALATFLSHLILPSYPALAGGGVLILFHSYLRFEWTWRKRGKFRWVLLVSLGQLLLFTLSLRLIYLLKGPSPFLFHHRPSLWDWCQLLLVHVVRAADFMDFIEGYGLEIQNIKTLGYLSGTSLVFLHLLVDFFLFTALYRMVSGMGLSKRMIPTISSVFKGLFLFLFAGSTLFLLVHFREYYPLLTWMAILLLMGMVLFKWPVERIKGWFDYEYRDWQAFFEEWMIHTFLFGAAGVALYLIFWQHHPWLETLMAVVMISFVLLMFCTIFLMFISYLRREWLYYWIPNGVKVLLSRGASFLALILVLFLPLILFTLALSGVAWWVQRTLPEWLGGQINYFLFGIEHLFRAIDFTDTSYIYDWNWSGVGESHWLFASVVVSYRFLASVFFYQLIYKLVFLWSLESLLPSSKIEEGLKNENPEIRKKALNHIIRIGDPLWIPVIIPLLDDEDLYVEDTAKKALSDLGSPDTISLLLPLMEGKKNFSNKGTVASLLTCWPTLPALFLLWSDFPSEAREILKGLDRKPVMEETLSRLEDPADKVRREAIEILMALESPPPLPGLLALLEDSSDQVRSTAHKAFHQWTGESGAPQLWPLLKNSHPEIRMEAIEELLKFSSVETLIKIGPLLKDNDPEVAQKARKALWKLGTELPPSEVLLRMDPVDQELKRLIEEAARWAAEEKERIRKAREEEERRKKKAAKMVCPHCGHQSVAPMNEGYWCSWCQKWAGR